MHKIHIKDRAASVVGEIEAVVGTLAGDAKNQVEALASQANATAEHVYGEARDEVRGAAASVATSVQQQPLIALLVVGLIGCIAGYLLGRR
jgi:uncharacterized protein YjbJ (UPF0337 family)